MAAVTVFQGGRVDLQPGTNARVRAADFGPGVAATALKTAGAGLQDFAEKQDQVEEVGAKVEANRLAIQFSEHARMIGNRVKQTLGEGADAAADQGSTDLEAAGKDILGQASPRARMLLEPEIGGKTVMYKDSFADHGFGEKVKAFDSSSNARIDSISEEAADTEDEAKGLAVLGSAGAIIDDQRKFFGRDKEWADGEKRKIASGFFKSRALKLTVGPNGSSLAAIEYATKNRGAMTDGDYNSVVSAYNDNALDEVATAEVYGKSSLSSTVKDVQDGDTSARRLDPLAFFKSFVSPYEGSAYVIDSNGHGVKYGVNGQYHPGENIKGMTEARAAAIFNKDYFIPSGADKLPPTLAAIHADTYWLNKTKAMQILKDSGGDPDRYTQMRQQFLDGLTVSNPAKYGRYKKGWTNRTNALKAFADRQGGDGQQASMPTITADTDLTTLKDSTMARSDIGMALKSKIIAMAERQRSDQRQERSIQREASQDKLTQAALALGDGFTDIKQLPQDALLFADPSTVQTFTNMAKSNRENKPLSPELAQYISFTEISDPKKYASKAFRDDLIAKGAPLATIRNLSERQGQIAGQLASLKPDVVSSGELWTIAGPAFQAAGLDYTRVDDPKAKKTERIADAAKKTQALGFLRDQATRWAIANPGKKAPEETIRQWVGFALRNTTRGRGFELDDHSFYDRSEPAQRQAAARAMMRIDPTWASKPVAQRITAVANFLRTRAATGD